MKNEFLKFAKWLNENQWTNNHYLKIAFCKCDYETIVKEYMRQCDEMNGGRGPEPLVKTGIPEYIS